MQNTAHIFYCYDKRALKKSQLYYIRNKMKIESKPMKKDY